MTEGEWLACVDMPAIVAAARPTTRKLRLWACACCELVNDLFRYDSFRQAIDIAYLHADGLASDSLLGGVHRRAAEGYPHDFQDLPLSAQVVHYRVLEAVCAASSSSSGSLGYTVWFNVALALEGKRLTQMHEGD